MDIKKDKISYNYYIGYIYFQILLTKLHFDIITVVTEKFDKQPLIQELKLKLLLSRGEKLPSIEQHYN